MPRREGVSLQSFTELLTTLTLFSERYSLFIPRLLTEPSGRRRWWGSRSLGGGRRRSPHSDRPVAGRDRHDRRRYSTLLPHTELTEQDGRCFETLHHDTLGLLQAYRIMNKVLQTLCSTKVGLVSTAECKSGLRLNLYSIIARLTSTCRVQQ